MSLVGQAFNKWLQRQNVSVMRQIPVEEYERKMREIPEPGEIPIPTPTPEPTICDAFPPNTQESMIAIAMDSAHKIREMGAAITHDYTLGKVITGTETRVPIPRPEGTMGTYHTHPFGWARPSPYDALDALSRDDKVVCIGASGQIGTKIKCFTPLEPKWSELKIILYDLDKDIALFNMSVGGKYKARGIRLRKLLNEIPTPDYIAKIQAMPPEQTKEEVVVLGEKAERAKTTLATSQTRAKEAAGELEKVRSKLAALPKDAPKETIRAVEFEVKDKEDEASRYAAIVNTEREFANNAVSDAEEAALKVKIQAMTSTQTEALRNEARDFHEKWVILERRKQELFDRLNRQLLNLAYKEEWRPQEKVNGWAAMPLMMDSCKILWETIRPE